jgi:hypothetical protein
VKLKLPALPVSGTRVVPDTSNLAIRLTPVIRFFPPALSPFNVSLTAASFGEGGGMVASSTEAAWASPVARPPAKSAPTSHEPSIRLSMDLPESGRAVR